MIWKKCQNMLRWSGQNANQKVGTDKMPTTEKSPDKMPTFGWHFVRLAFCPHTMMDVHRIIAQSVAVKISQCLPLDLRCPGFNRHLDKNTTCSPAA